MLWWSHPFARWTVTPSQTDPRCKINPGTVLPIQCLPPVCTLPEPLGDTLRLRIKGLDCPEKHTPQCEAERASALSALEYTTAQMERPPTHVRLCGWDKYATG